MLNSPGAIGPRFKPPESGGTAEYRPFDEANTEGALPDAEIPVGGMPTIDYVTTRNLVIKQPDLKLLSDAYEMVSQTAVGRGGMAEVFQVKRKSDYPDRFALKILRSDLPQDRKKIARFLTEIELLRQLGGEKGHPNIITIYDSGIFNEKLAVVEEFADGKSLHEKIKTIEIADLVKIMIQISNALHYAHTKKMIHTSMKGEKTEHQGTIHRDLKPENILFIGETPKICDFGVAKITNSSATISEETSFGAIAGTTAYLSPEEARYGLSPKETFVETPQVDIYGVGAILYLGATKKIPIPVSDGIRSHSELVADLQRITQHEPEAICKLNPKIHPEFGAFIMSLLVKNPYERFRNCQNAKILAARLQSYLDDRLV